MTVSGALDGQKLAKGVCAWVETGRERVEIWVDEQYGQVFVFDNDNTFTGIYTLDRADRTPDALVAAHGARVTVTGTTYVSTPQCGAYGVRATKPITSA